MKKYLFIDDERNPENVKWIHIPKDVDWNIVRSYDQAIKWVVKYGFPDVISFDHDLGSNEKTGYDIAKWLVELDRQNHNMPKDFKFIVHSLNPIGAKNIQEYILNYLNIKRII